MKRIREWWDGLRNDVDSTEFFWGLGCFLALILGVGLLIFVMAKSWSTPQPDPKPTPQAVPGTFIGPCPMFVELPVWEWEDVERIGGRVPGFVDSVCLKLRWEELD